MVLHPHLADYNEICNFFVHIFDYSMMAFIMKITN